MIDKKWIGHSLDTTRMTLERGRLRAFARAIGETDPVYTQVEAAHAAGYADLPAPPSFLFGAELDAGTLDRMLADLEIPIARILHGEQGFTYHKPVCAGETVTVQSRIADLFDKKNGALEFLVKTSEVRNDNNELVAELRTVLVVRN
ncbi:acyl dehydratase [Pseudomonas citronellolis]|uniref:MaoC family dehydratase N-terminal domain-containing protein n=1 Tax=Pseudomonas citronellolis TaxID=53408 RepID=UPI00209D0EDF|nr:MaoC family dehydratase N-terminal domain-containing protein [Pseudomonas citronellolis]MCP1644868.1 acyl dehydratase [Pseudomonas citronellolis]MCP1667813.1 acyl dehydratase [Pseudomonas citronellolis]MCP1699091.1 acyl dehydratase [Pseudomonas citronellolis]MCP1704920.1 acyl dehydratase [Pseudomonas citronellolis]MCP1799654.1 acyl dehydratase [Pseudomonas citronellolis]